MLPVHVAISLDMLDPQRYRRIRGAGLERVLNGIELLREHRRAKMIVCIASELNRTDVEDVVRFARECRFIPVVGAYHSSVVRYGKPASHLTYEPTALVPLFESLRNGGRVLPGLHRDYLDDNVRWLSGAGLEPCDAGRYAVAVDASGNVSTCLVHPIAGDAFRDSFDDIIDRFDRAAIRRCSDASRGNLAWSRVVHKSLRHPISAVQILVALQGKARS